MTGASEAEGNAAGRGHRLRVRLTHWLIAGAVLVLMISGVTILLTHPRLYWGEAGNDLIEPLLEIPIGPVYRNSTYSPGTPFFASPDGPVSADLVVNQWNQNSWARSLHFLAAWCFVAGLLAYFAFALAMGHARRVVWPRRSELALSNLWQDVRAHLRPPMPAPEPGPPYAILQKLAYGSVVFVALPLMVLTGITMSPGIVANYPVLLDLFGGTQSARTIHFFAFAFLSIFLVVHLAMILLTGPLRQLRGMTLGQ